MSVLIKILFGVIIIGVMFLGVQAIGNTGPVQTQLDHLGATFSFIVGNIRNMSAVFPWVLDVVIMFSAIIIIELVLLGWKVSVFIAKMTHRG